MDAAETRSGDLGTNHAVVFKVMGTVKETWYGKVLEKVAAILDEGKSIPVREPDVYDSET